VCGGHGRAMLARGAWASNGRIQDEMGGVKGIFSRRSAVTEDGNCVRSAGNSHRR